MKNIYLDNNATTRVSASVVKAMHSALKYRWGNPSSGYRVGKMAAQVMEKSRDILAEAVGAHSHEVYFSSCATEWNNAILKSLSNSFYPEKKKIISTPIEHPSVMNTLGYLQTQGIVVEYCDVDKYGKVSPEQIAGMMDGDTFLVCCMLANNELGTIQNVKEVSRLAKEKGVLVFSDCVQALGKIPINVKELGADYATFSAHKLYGPKGCGAMYARITAPEIQFVHGGHQEEGLRAGTESVHNIAGFGAACKQIPKLIAHAEKEQGLKHYFAERLKELNDNITINSPRTDCLPNTLSIIIHDKSNSEVLQILDYYGIAVSAGSACSTSLDKPSHVLMAIGLSEQEARETIRVSLGIDTTKRDIDYTLKIFGKHLM